LYHILAIGPLPIKNDVIGGTKVSFESFCESLQRDPEVNLSTLNTSRPMKGKSRLEKLLLNLSTLSKVLVTAFWGSFRYDVIIWNLSATALFASGPLFWLFTRFGKAKIILRLFGGDLDSVFQSKPRLLQKILSKMISDFDGLLLQTKILVDKFEGFNRHVIWFPTTRDLQLVDQATAPTCNRFAYLGQIRKEKGIPEIIAASRSVKGNIKVSICGPLMHPYDPRDEIRGAGAEYLEPVDHEDIARFLSNFDALLFPSYYEGEGYPGVVIEALQMGLPVIATNWRSLPEIVVDNQNGVIIEARNEKVLCEAMTRLNQDSVLFQRLRRGAIDSGQQFKPASSLARLKAVFSLLVNGKPVSSSLCAVLQVFLAPVKNPA